MFWDFYFSAFTCSSHSFFWPFNSVRRANPPWWTDILLGCIPHRPCSIISCSQHFPISTLQNVYYSFSSNTFQFLLQKRKANKLLRQRKAENILHQQSAWLHSSPSLSDAAMTCWHCHRPFKLHEATTMYVAFNMIKLFDWNSYTEIEFTQQQSVPSATQS